MKIVKELVSDLVRVGMVPAYREDGMETDYVEKIIAAKLEPVKAALVCAWNAGLIAKETLNRFQEES